LCMRHAHPIGHLGSHLACTSTPSLCAICNHNPPTSLSWPPS
jgi:hypothetical protein